LLIKRKYINFYKIKLFLLYKRFYRRKLLRIIYNINNYIEFYKTKRKNKLIIKKLIIIIT